MSRSKRDARALIQQKMREDYDGPKKRWVTRNLADLDEDVLEALWTMYASTYEGIGLVVHSISELMGKYKIAMLIDVDDDPMPDAFSIFKETKFGKKMVLSGTDGSKPAKRALVGDKIKKLNQTGWYVEASHRIADILLANGINVVDNQADVEKVVGKKVQWRGDGSNQYDRRVGGGTIAVTKRLFGKPRGIL